jgi:hypothetical protein
MRSTDWVSLAEFIPVEGDVVLLGWFIKDQLADFSVGHLDAGLWVLAEGREPFESFTHWMPLRGPNR